MCREEEMMGGFRLGRVSGAGEGPRDGGMEWAMGVDEDEDEDGDGDDGVHAWKRI